jgi:two-component system, OmpR family, sensor histidine kinase KdpD
MAVEKELVAVPTSTRWSRFAHRHRTWFPPAESRTDSHVTLSEVDRRRVQLWSVSVFVVGALTVFLAVLVLGEQFLPEVLRVGKLSSWIVAVLVGGLLLAFLIYVVEKEISLRRLTKLLVEERVRSTALAARLTELSALSEVGKALNDTLRVDEVFRLILSSTLEPLGGTEGVIMLLDDSKRELEVVSYAGPRELEMLGHKIKLDDRNIGVVARERLPRLLQADDLVPASSNGFFKGANSVISVPLVRRGELLGVFNVHETAGVKVFSELDLTALEFFAEHAAIAIANARLFESEKETISRLEELDKLKSDFVATVSHELKTPLTAIIGGAKTVNTRGDRMTPEQHTGFMEMIERQGTRLLRLVEDVLTTSRIESGLPRLSRELVDLRKLVDSVVEDLIHSMEDRRHDITVVVEQEQPQVWGDPTALHQVLGNLVENALKYSNCGDRVRVVVSEDSRQAVLEVNDEGQGIAPDRLTTIFDRFRQAGSLPSSSVSGFGLGLYIVKNLVEAHRGEIEVDSEHGSGSTFRVLLPKRSETR